MSDVSVVIGTYGDFPKWSSTAQRAVRSVEAQTVPAELFYVHGPSLARARNAGIQAATGPWIVCLDADDELDPKYVEAMLAGEGDLRQPSTLGIVDGREDPSPVLIKKKPLLDGNYLVIGTMFSREMFMEVGGFKEWPLYEDWDLWIRCWRKGAVISACPEAIYRIHVSTGSRNDATRGQAVKIYNEIRNQYANG